MANKNDYEFRHKHRFGFDVYHFRSQRPHNQLPALGVVAHLLDIDYEPQTGSEWAEIVLIESHDLDELILEKGK